MREENNDSFIHLGVWTVEEKRGEDDDLGEMMSRGRREGTGRSGSSSNTRRHQIKKKVRGENYNVMDTSHSRDRAPPTRRALSHGWLGGRWEARGPPLAREGPARARR